MNRHSVLSKAIPKQKINATKFLRKVILKEKRKKKSGKGNGKKVTKKKSDSGNNPKSQI